ncbi:MAG: helix-turn-helix domain-containing protein, partial [Caldilineaceae bacterium]|nr:helix-turn-helix domain-containing protein [Caldilineaceae bacterium]
CPPIVPGKPLEALIWVRCQLADGGPTALALAQDALTALAAVTKEYHDVAFHLETQVLQSLLADAQGRESASLALLRPAVSLAAAQGAPLIFIGHGPAMVKLLQRLAAEPQMANAAYVLLGAIEHAGGGILTRPLPNAAASSARCMVHYEELTHRELQIVALLARRLSNEEIAASLNISPHTVRNHLANLYAKLDVSSRRAAVARAGQQGLLPAATKQN